MTDAVCEKGVSAPVAPPLRAVRAMPSRPRSQASLRSISRSKLCMRCRG